MSEGYDLEIVPNKASDENKTGITIKGSEIEKTVKAAKWKMAEDGEGRLKMEDEGGTWGWKSPEDGSAAQSSAHPCPPCNR